MGDEGLPPLLRPWQGPLRRLPMGAIEAVGPMVAPLAALVGPMVTLPALGGPEPDGLSGLSRRGPYERLLVTEWAMADAAPLEFLRRASTGEQLFWELARRTPSQGRRCVVLVDAGPDQLGCPRLVQVALLVVLAQRAIEGHAEFYWAPLQGVGTLHAGVTRNAVMALYEARTLDDPTAEDVERRLAEAHAVAEAVHEELWMVGGERLDALAEGLETSRRGVRRVHIAESWDDDVIEIEVHGQRRGTRRAKVPRPDNITAKSAFRRPFERPRRPALPRAPVPASLRASLQEGFRFNDEGSRLVGLEQGTGEILGLRVWGTQRRSRARPKRLWLEPDRRVVAVGWHDRRPLAVSVGRDGQGALDGLGPRRWLGSSFVAPPPTTMGHVVHAIRGPSAELDTHEVWIGVANGPLWTWRYRVDDEAVAVPDEICQGLARRDGRLLALCRHRDLQQTQAVLYGPHRDEVTGDVILHDHEPWWPSLFVGPASAPGNPTSKLGVLAWHVGGGVWRIHGMTDDPVEIALTAAARPWGVTWVPDGERSALPALVATLPGVPLALVTPSSTRALPLEQDVVWACASPASRAQVAWLDAEGRIVVFDLVDNVPSVRFSTRQAP